MLCFFCLVRFCSVFLALRLNCLDRSLHRQQFVTLSKDFWHDTRLLKNIHQRSRFSGATMTREKKFHDEIRFLWDLVSTLCGFWCCRFSINVSTRQPIPASTDDCSEVTAHLSSLVKKPWLQKKPTNPSPPLRPLHKGLESTTILHTHTHTQAQISERTGLIKAVRKEEEAHAHARMHKQTHTRIYFLPFFLISSPLTGIWC